MRHVTMLLAYVVVMAFVLAGGCSSRRSEPLRGPLVLKNQSQINGERAFMEHCHQCHPNGERGLGPALNNKPVPGFVIKTQVLIGGGVMPSFDENHLPDQELDDLVAYLKALR